ncbi:MAG: hypothetical protein MJZ53_03820 [Paludibacteraceae bacterium]|nr:hypothetical protein [Paludibacteraceae bacterium]
MKTKSFVMALVALACAFCFTACKSSTKSTTVEVTVLKNGQAVANETVYQFTTSLWNQEAFKDPFYAKRQAVTNDNGVAVFELQSVQDLEVIDNQTTLYYATFNGKTLTGYAGVTVKEGDNKQVTISQQ